MSLHQGVCHLPCTGWMVPVCWVCYYYCYYYYYYYILLLIGIIIIMMCGGDIKIMISNDIIITLIFTIK